MVSDLINFLCMLDPKLDPKAFLMESVSDGLLL